MRLIDADALMKWLNNHYDDEQVSIGYVSEHVKEQPTVDAVPVERDIPKAPTDQLLEEDGYGAWGSLYGNCPNCGESVYEEQNYCEKCGQRLNWGKEE